jgi:hypothetical protein
MRRVLIAAGLYNLAWGAWVGIFPAALFDALHMAQPNYPQLWQCIGMIVGVCGVGYLIAASNPARHWPIVLVGLLGKILGPLGMVHALWTGVFPWTFALNCLTNDLIWWIPFALILRHAWTTFREEPESASELATLLDETIPSLGTSLAALSHQHPVLVVCLRHSGCTFCREALADLGRQRAAIERSGTRLVLVHMGDAVRFAVLAGRYGLGDVPVIADPGRRLYRGLGLRRGSLAQLLGLRVWWRGARAFFSGHGLGTLDGDGAQMPGAFVICDGEVTRRFVHATAADRPDYAKLCLTAVHV